MATRVLIVSDIAVHREGLEGVLRQCPRLEVLGSVATSAIDTLPRNDPPSVALIDAPAVEACDIARALRAALPDARLVAIGVIETEPTVLAYAEAGIGGYSTCDCSGADLVEIIDRVARGELVCSPRIAGRLMRHVAALADRGTGLAGGGELLERLTPRELEVLTSIRAGLSNKEIAQQLSLSLPTVKCHVHNILEKLGARNRTEAARAARAGGI